MTYDVSTVERLTGIPRATLLAWERRYGVVQPERLPNGYRAYSEEEVAVLRDLKELTDAGHRVGEAIRLVGRSTAGQRTTLQDLLEALERFDRERVEVLDVRIAELGMLSRLQRVYEPLLDALDEPGRFTAAQVRLGRSWARMRLSAMLTAVGLGSPGRPAVVSCRMDGDDERALVDHLHLVLRGHAIVPLGADTEHEVLLEAAERAEAQAVVVGGATVAELTAIRVALPAHIGLVALQPDDDPAPEGVMHVEHPSEVETDLVAA